MKGISIIICCYNSEKLLPETLKHISLQKVCNTLRWEVIVVNNNSSDKTKEIACEEWNKYSHSENCSFQIVDEPNPGLSNARKKGFESSVYDIIIYCDDDNWLCEDYVQTAYESMIEDDKIAVIGGYGEPVFENNYKPEWFHYYASTYALGEQKPKITKSVYGAGIVMKKKALQNLYNTGFTSLLTDRKGNELSSGGDSELCLALVLLGYNIEYNSRLKFKHYIIRQRLNYAYLEKLFVGFAQSKVILTLYIDFIDKKNINIIFYPVRKILISFIQILYHQIHPQFKHKRKLYIIHDKVTFIEYIKLFSLIRSYIRTIKQLRNNT